MEPLRPYSVDCLSMWIQNRQLLETFDDTQIKLPQNDIIETVFGGFKSLMQLLLQQPYKLTITHHHKLYEVLTNNILDATTENKSDERNITDLPDDCLSHTMKFLTNNERYTIQQCCKLFTITARQEYCVNNIDIDLPLMGITPYQRTIYDGFISNNHNKNMESFELYLKYIDCSPDIEIYSKPLFDKFKRLLIENKSNPTVIPIICSLGHSLHNLGILSLIPDILNNMVLEAQNAHKHKLNKPDGKSIQAVLAGISSNVRYSGLIDDIMKCDGLIQALYNALPYIHLFEFETKWSKGSALGDGLGIICGILKYSYTTYRKMVVEAGLFDVLFMVKNTINDHYESCFLPCDMETVLEMYLRNVSSEDIDSLLDHFLIDQCFVERSWLSTSIQDLLLKLITNSNVKQRSIIIEKCIQCRYMDNDSFKGKVMEYLISVHDIEAQNKLEEFEKQDLYSWRLPPDSESP